MKRVIIESPYAASPKATVAEHVHYACSCMYHSITQGEAPFASHLVYPIILDDTDSAQRSLGIQAGYEWMQAADIVAFYTDFGWSPGMIKALKVARLLSLRIEARSIEGRSTMLPPEVESLLEAKVIQEVDTPVSGVRAFRFIGEN